ncbi:hypothetical protein PoB_002051300 [Plakobranchus ocellatus]|uniref:Uncharacterized protein n=1 Tax=Plakobranchus ocellatus TaxID=259542 RepID=A0AAV3ZGS1_9GAST|nr:hypothetical protein PoB_002051300 [Plakobranchus ocellatus]
MFASDKVSSKNEFAHSPYCYRGEMYQVESEISMRSYNAPVLPNHCFSRFQFHTERYGSKKSLYFIIYSKPPPPSGDLSATDIGEHGPPLKLVLN